jgi:hypothetical protein
MQLTLTTPADETKTKTAVKIVSVRSTESGTVVEYVCVYNDSSCSTPKYETLAASLIDSDLYAALATKLSITGAVSCVK